MPKLRSRDNFPPGQFQYLIPEIGMRKAIEGSFMAVVNEVIKIRKANPYLTEKYGWRTDVAGVESDVEAQNVARLQAHGWTQWLTDDDSWIEPPPYPDPQKKTHQWAGAAAGSQVKRVAAGVAVLLDWIGSSGKPVEPELSEKRAVVCSTCPKNDLKRDFKSYFTVPVAEKIRLQLEMKNDLRLKTSQDDKLGVCTACDCPLRLKVHVPIEHITNHTSGETIGRLDPRCWIPKEWTPVQNK